MDDRVETGWLFAFYGPLLTERQRKLLTLGQQRAVEREQPAGFQLFIHVLHLIVKQNNLTACILYDIAAGLSSLFA